ncbi:hypothetical protein [Nocardia transvalensis]|uniref:hypothetical protein n=1 Tax=Nocardia transvalensis TaxID=37333 RepID=UPI001893003C|nr:hypothetical protein [Nocardia transvalensis]MBF6333115.1 hypothetical protein [Nocardia transvalensis]
MTVVGMSKEKTIMFRAVWAVSGLAVAVSVLLLIGAFTADSAAGESGQVAGMLGLIGLLFGGAIAMAGALVRFGVTKSASRGIDHDH